jgi:hypothetical protein
MPAISAITTNFGFLTSMQNTGTPNPFHLSRLTAQIALIGTDERRQVTLFDYLIRV